MEGNQKEGVVPSGNPLSSDRAETLTGPRVELRTLQQNKTDEKVE